MWPFSRKMLLSGILAGSTDWHSHILPAVDDGVRTAEESLQILEAYEAQGVSKVWLTPHIMEDYPNTTQDLRTRFAELKSLYKGSVELCLASENMLDTLFVKRLQSDDLLPIGDEGRHLLVETSYFNPPMDLYGMLGELKSKGYTPVLAHPERYSYMTEKDYKRLAEMNVVMQLNVGSLLG
ncbi:MAG: capsular biosynthesis protein, partial [Bacteroidales bacterium]|nr:capsular biosynthesis protein [Bacteroidales bacterium]